MTPADEARFIQLWQAGTETAAIAQALGIPVGTVSSRAHVLQRQGKIQARPRGGPHARRVAQARQVGERPPSTVYRPPGHLGAETGEALGPMDHLRAPGRAGGVAASGRRPRAQPQLPGARGLGPVASRGAVHARTW